ncbi:MAG: extracellular solute-binding protein [Thermoleophilia bacterium]|nr:extracellular solute-binding protein [Thermoleophilia bacterium]
MLSRRRFLQLAGGGLAAAGLAPILAACGGDDGGGGEGATAEAPSDTSAPETQAPTGGGTLTWWWWGEQEAPGLQTYVDESVAAYEKATGTKVETTLLDTGNVIPQFTDASAAGKPPDLQYFWNGIYHMENVWHGYIEPLNGLVPDEVLQQSGATPLSIYQGKQYRVGWYAIGMGLTYNKALFEAAGLDPDSPPATWDAFLDACDKLKASGVNPFGGGVKDGYLGEWWLGGMLAQNLDTPADAINLFIGELDWQDPRYHDFWIKLRELHDLGFINDDINSLELYQGIQLMTTNKLAIVPNTTTQIPGAQEQLGEDGVGWMAWPNSGTGKMAGLPVLDAQGLGIASGSENKESAAAFLEFMQTPERLTRLWEVCQQIPSNTTFDAAAITNPTLKAVHDVWSSSELAPHLPNMMPTLFWTDAMFVATQKILAGNMTGEEAGELAAEITEKWKAQNPDLVENYATWSQDLAV